MLSDTYWIELQSPGRLAIMARPRGGEWLEDELTNWQTNGIDWIVSLLEPSEVAELGLIREAFQCATLGIEFTSFPIADRGVPRSVHETTALALRVATSIGDGASVAIHCRAGIGRSALLAARTLTHFNMDTNTALARIGKARGYAVPDTSEQREWLLALASTNPARSF